MPGLDILNNYFTCFINTPCLVLRPTFKLFTTETCLTGEEGKLLTFKGKIFVFDTKILFLGRLRLYFTFWINTPCLVLKPTFKLVATQTSVT